MKITMTRERNILFSWRLSNWLLVGIFLLVSFKVQSQCALNCTNIQLSLDEDCSSPVTWQMLTNGIWPGSCVGPLLVEVRTASGQLIPTSPVVTGAYANQTLTGKLIDQQSGNFCQSLITVEDKLKPKLTCKDTVITCFHPTTPSVTGTPVATDNCTNPLTPVYSDNVTQFSCAVSDTISIINRLWSATDASGNLGFCIQKIYVRRPSLQEISMPPNLDNEDAPALYCLNANTSPSTTGEPSFNGIPIDSFCSYLATYSDVIVPVCNGSYTVFREWEIYDGCNASSMSAEQIIQVVDTVPPQLVCPGNLSVNTGNLDCTATVLLPQPSTFDDCSNTVTLSFEGSYGVVTGNTIYNLPHGVYPSKCHATDGCGNTTTCNFTIQVKDNVPPVAVAVSQANVTLLPAEPTYVNASTFDGGSWDNCSNLVRKIRRLDAAHCPGNDGTAFDDVCPFYCCDAGKTVMVELRVIDVGGNMSTSLSSAYVTDNLNPGIICPADITIECGDDYEDTGLTGLPTTQDNCSGVVVEYSDSVNINNCGTGLVLRTWSVEDASGRVSSCTQNIAIENSSPFHINSGNPNDPNDDVVWPANYIANSCGQGLNPELLPAGYGYPQIQADTNCTQISMSYTDTWFAQPNNACIEILRSWLVIDWCQFNQTNFQGSWQYGQVIRIQQSSPPVFTSSCDNRSFCSNNDCEDGQVSLLATATDDCTAAGLLKYEYKIDLFNDGSVNQSGFSAQVSDIFPTGTHRITFTVEDGCQNKTDCSYLFTVRDCKAPTPKCKSMTATLLPAASPAVEIKALSLDDGSWDNCSAAEDLLFSFSGNTADTIRAFHCDDLGEQELELWVTDEEGNQHFCMAEVQISPGNQFCANALSLSGGIVTADSLSVAQVVVAFNDQSGPVGTVTTEGNGQYVFSNLTPGGDYTVTPGKNINPNNGVTTFDLVLISKHILGAVPLDSPYKIIAADVNRSNSVTTFDLVVLRRMILLIDTEFPNNTSWRFVKRDFQFTNPANPFADNFPEVVSVNNLSSSEQINFIAIKVGDVNGTANPQQ